MKVKLLKKIRKRYVILYYPKEITIFDETFKGECMILDDLDSEYNITGVEICEPSTQQEFWRYGARTKEEARVFLMAKLVKWIANDYKKYRTRKVKQTIETIWYAKKPN